MHYKVVSQDSLESSTEFCSVILPQQVGGPTTWISESHSPSVFEQRLPHCAISVRADVENTFPVATPLL